MLQSSLLLVLGLVLLTAGADLLVRGGASFARRLGLNPLVVGLTIVAFGTSAPELVVSMNGAMRGLTDLAAGNVVGSNIFNITVILGLSAVITPLRIQRSVIRREAPLMLVVSLLGAGFMLTGGVTRLGGVALLAMLAAYTVFSVISARRETAMGADTRGTPSGRRCSVDLMIIVAGLGLLMAGSRFFIDGALVIARSSGVSEVILGLTIVAAGTSLPELATSVMAAVRREADIAVGNILGSNIFNVLGVLGATACVHPLRPAGITLLDLGMMVGLAAVLWPLLISGRRLVRWEGVLLLMGYGGYLWVRWPAG